MDWRQLFILQMHRPRVWPGITTLSGGTIQQPYGRYQLEPTSPTSVESMRMVTLRIKLDTNLVQGETEPCVMLCCGWLDVSLARCVMLHGMYQSFFVNDLSDCCKSLCVRIVQEIHALQLLQHTVWVTHPPPKVFILFPQRLGIFSPNLTRYYTFLFTIDYKFLFSYMQLWRSYAMLSVATSFTSYAQNVHHRLKRTLGGRT